MKETGFTERDITLRDGRAVHVRAVREPNRDRLRRLLASFPAAGTAIVATVRAADGFDIVGSAMFVLLDDPARGEFAATVREDFSGAGLARRLMSVLIDAARERGLKELEGIVLAENQPMLGLAHRLGFVISVDPDDRALRICRLPLDGCHDQRRTSAAPGMLATSVSMSSRRRPGPNFSSAKLGPGLCQGEVC